MQYSQLSNEELEGLEQEAEQKGAAAVTKWAMKGFEA